MRVHATFVVPAPSGCNLNCPYCAIRLRNEAQETHLQPRHYIRFLRSLLASEDVETVSIVGYEPTLDDAFELSDRLLGMGKDARARTSLNTNGIDLPRCADRLAKVCDVVLISLDSHLPGINDRMRGKAGTFARTLRGIDAAMRHMGPDRVIVNSLLQPKHVDRLAEMPSLLASIGVRRWIVSPFIDFRNGISSQMVPDIRQAIQVLFSKAERSGVALAYADEFSVIGRIDGIPVHNFQKPGHAGDLTLRLSPNGTCSTDEQILYESKDAVMWNGEENPETFLGALFDSDLLRRYSPLKLTA